MNVDINPAAALSRNAKYFKDHLAVIYNGGSLTFEALDDRVRRLASVLIERGLAEGDRVSFLGMNSTSYVVTMLATMRIGAIFVPLNFRLTESELTAALSRCTASALIVESNYDSVVQSALKDPALKTALLVDDDPCCPVTQAVEFAEPWSALIESAIPHTTATPRTFGDPAVILFSSGSTGNPKGIILTHGNLWWNSINTDMRMDTQRRDVTLASAPLFHIGALNSFVLRALVRGGTSVLRREFDPAAFLDDIEELGINSTFAVPTMLEKLLEQADIWSRDLSSLRVLVVSGSPVPQSLLEAYARGGIALQQAWGMTEFAPTATHLPPELALEKVGSAGIPMPYTEVRIIDPTTGVPVPSMTPGELVVRGPNVTPGYWQDPESTQQTIDENGWFHSGDIGYVDEDGFFFIVDRLRDVIISGGENIYSAEVERVLADIPGIIDVAVVGTPDSKWGETVTAVCSVEAGTELSLNDIHESAREHLARYKLPQKLHIIEAVPRNALGKLDKPKVRSMVLQDAAEASRAKL